MTDRPATAGHPLRPPTRRTAARWAPSAHADLVIVLLVV